MKLRPYGPGDREACLHLFDTNVGTFFVPQERAGFEDFLDDLPGPYFVGEEDGEVVACGGYGVDEDGEADLCWGIVHRGHQGRGLGRRLMEHRLQAVQADTRCRAVRLQTIPATEGFFHRMGFRTTSVEPDGFGPGMDRVAMRMELEGTPG